MKSWNPCKRRDFISKLKALGFKGPYAGSKHQFMVYGQHRLSIPSNKEYTIPQLKMMIDEISLITAEDVNPEYWNNL